jgi:hypothetical protein
MSLVESFSSTIILKYISPFSVIISTLSAYSPSGSSVAISLSLPSFATIDALCLSHSVYVYRVSILSMSFWGSCENNGVILKPHISLIVQVNGAFGVDSIKLFPSRIIDDVVPSGLLSLLITLVSLCVLIISIEYNPDLIPRYYVVPLFTDWSRFNLSAFAPPTAVLFA